MNAIVLLRRFAVLTLLSTSLITQGFADDVGKGAELLKTINSQNLDDTIDVLNQVKQTRHRGDVLPVLMDLWKNDEQKYPSLPWSFVNLDVVRINIADILVQAHRNGEVDAPTGQIHGFTKRIAASSGDIQAQSAALLVLGIIDDARDIPVLKSVAIEERQLTSTSALIALGMMCSEDAGKTLAALVGSLKDQVFVERAKTAQRLHRDMADSKGGWCSSNLRPFI